MSEPTPDDLLQQIADAEAGKEAAVIGRIYLELDQQRMQVVAARDQAGAAVHDSWEKLAEPRAHLDRLDGRIADAEGRCVEWSHQLSDKDPDVRADARRHYEEWAGEVDIRRAERDQAEREYREQFEHHERLSRHLRALEGADAVLLEAMVNPFTDAIAKATDAYKDLRRPMLGEVLMLQDVTSPEWPEAIAQLRDWCIAAMMGGHDIAADLPSFGELAARAMTSGLADAATTPPDPAPSMGEVMKATELEFETMRVAGIRDVIDDRRGAQLRPAPPGRSHMDVPFRVKDLPG